MGIGARASRLTPSTIAVIYVIVGAAWILFSDQLVYAAIADPAVVASVQTVKGWVFVLASASVVYVLVTRSQRELEETNERLDLALQQTSILHRILRHNLRNSCNVIYGNAQMLEERRESNRDDATESASTGVDLVAEDRRPAGAIEAEIESLLEITEKTRLLRNVVLFDSTPNEMVDVAAAVASRVGAVRDRNPEASIRTELPVAARVETHPEIAVAVEELLENAIVHQEGPSPTVRVSVEPISHDESPPSEAGKSTPGSAPGPDAEAPAGTGGKALDEIHDGVVIEIEDDGPGIPKMEREVLEAGVERQKFHSVGLGLWLAQTLVTESGGDLEIDSDDEGTVVRVRLP